MSEREGQAKVLRAKVEQVEREKRELQTRVAQGSQGAMAAFQAQELQRQLDIARQSLAHKDQEVLPPPRNVMLCIYIMAFGAKQPCRGRCCKAAYYGRPVHGTLPRWRTRTSS